MRSLKVSIDLREKFGPPRDQGARPTCLAFAASDAHAAARIDWMPLSCEYVFYYSQRRSNRPPNSGALLPSMLETLKGDGQPIESDWPYLLQGPKNEEAWIPPKGIGEIFRIDGTSCSHDIESILAQLNQRLPCILLIKLSRAFDCPEEQGIVDLTSNTLPQPERRHAVVAIGHGLIDGQRAILIRNSWGSHWGENGFGWLTESFINASLFAAAILLEEIHVSTNPATT
jgi:Papain family cysteine protease